MTGAAGGASPSDVLSIVVPSYNRPHSLARLLEALASLDPRPIGLEVIVVDDGSDPPLEPTLAPYRDRLPLISIRQENRGCGPARQAGTDRAGGSSVAFLDDDVIPPPDWFSRVVRALADHPGCAVGGHTENGLSGNLFATTSQLIIDYLYERANREHEQSTFFTTNNVTFPREGLSAIGGLDRCWVNSGGEDRDLCARWVDSGRRMVYRPDIRLRHEHHLTLLQFVGQHTAYGRGAYLFRRRIADRAGSWPGLEAPLFYLGLFFYPYRRLGLARAVAVQSLVVLSQFATAWGFLLEATRGGAARRPPRSSSTPADS